MKQQIVEKQISAFIQLNEKLMSNANAYTNLIMVAGYFAFWSTLAGKKTLGYLIPAALLSRSPVSAP
jgi:hypothetical protein